jgi:hypothetical protein
VQLDQSAGLPLRVVCLLAGEQNHTGRRQHRILIGRLKPVNTPAKKLRFPIARRDELRRHPGFSTVISRRCKPRPDHPPNVARVVVSGRLVDITLMPISPSGSPKDDGEAIRLQPAEHKLAEPGFS